MSVHTRIKEFRESRKLTHQQFADQVGVSRGAVQQWERGLTAPNRKKQPKVAKFMEITVAELMSENDLIDLAKAQQSVSSVTLHTSGQFDKDQSTEQRLNDQQQGDVTMEVRHTIEGLRAHLKGVSPAHRQNVLSALTTLIENPDDQKSLDALAIFLNSDQAFAGTVQKRA